MFEETLYNFLKGIGMLFILGQLIVIPMTMFILHEISNEQVDNAENIFEYYQFMFLSMGKIALISSGVLLIDILIISFGFIYPAIKNIQKEKSKENYVL